MIRFNPEIRQFVTRTDLLKDGWDYFDRDDGIRLFSTPDPYKVVQYFDDCDPGAKEQIELLHHEYRCSLASSSNYEPPYPKNMVPYPYQRAGVEYALKRRNTIIGDDPGSGKSAQAIMFCNAVKAKKILVICPASLRLNWEREIKMWTTLDKYHIYVIGKGEDGVNPFSNFVIISYDLCRNETINKVLREMGWDVLIMDEAHYAKTPEAGRTRAIFGTYSDPTSGVANSAKRVLALTGTPLPNRPREAYVLIRGLNWASFENLSERAFHNRYNPSFQHYNGHVEERTGHLSEMRARLRCNIMVRRLKVDVLKDLPPKRYQLAYVNDNSAISKVLAKERMLDFNVDDLENIDPEMWGHIATVRREMSVAKAPLVASHCAMLRLGGVEKMVIFAYHRNTMDIIQEALGVKNTVRIDGSVSLTNRQLAVDIFQSDPNIPYFIGQLTAAGTGWTLTAASHLVFADASWTPGENEQCVDRCHRIGQKSSVLAQFLVAPGSLDEKILGGAIEKLKTTNIALDGLE